jgi:large subunit ribosomal protein L24
MDKLARRVRMAERQVARRLKKEAKTEYLWTTKMERMRTTKELGRDASKSIKQAIVARREDWELGPLAPRRDVPRVELNAADNAWGTIGVTRALMSLKLNERQLEARCAWAGGSKYLCLMPGDRVVVVEGTMKGKIDKVAEINIEEGVVQLADAKVRLLLFFSLADRRESLLLTCIVAW